MERAGGGALVLRETSEWLRYALLGGALAMGLLALFSLVLWADFMKVVGSLLGAVLFVFVAFVTEGRRVVVDPARREVVVTSRGLEERAERFAFADIRRLMVVASRVQQQDAQGASVSVERWALALGLEGRAVMLTRSFYLTREQAMLDAKAIQARLPVEISESAQEGVVHLPQSARTVKGYVGSLFGSARNQQGS